MHMHEDNSGSVLRDWWDNEIFQLLRHNRAVIRTRRDVGWLLVNRKVAACHSVFTLPQDYI